MSESFEKAVEAAWLAMLGRPTQSSRTIRAGLRAALPHLTAEDVPHVAWEAWFEGWDAETAWQDDIDHRTIPTVERKDNPYAEEATDDHA